MTKPRVAISLVMLTSAIACGGVEATETRSGPASVDPGTVLIVRDTILPDVVEAPATVEPGALATVSTKLMGRVIAVAAREGDVVSAGALLVRVDARDVAARREQAEAALQSAQAARTEATLHASRLRALYADSAAPRAQLDAAEAGLERAVQGVRAARATIVEAEALADYADVRAPFAGVVTQRFVDPGAFAVPGSPLITIEDPSRLRVVAAVAPSMVSSLERGAKVTVFIEGVKSAGTVEGIVPVAGASLVNVRVIVNNQSTRFSSGSAATVSIAGAPRSMLLVPKDALVRAGDLTGVRIVAAGGPVTRWVRVGRAVGDAVEVLSGLSSGDRILVPALPAGN